VYDRIEKIDGSKVQHGKLSDRVYLMSLSKKSFPEIVDTLEELAGENGYSKIFAKIPDWALPTFERAGHGVEAEIPGFFGGEHDAYFTGKYLEERRERERHPEAVEEVLQAAVEKPPETGEIVLPAGLEFREAEPEDAGAMAGVYREVFATYPFPIHEPDFIKETMDDGGTRYFGVWDGEDIAALASSEISLAEENAEMTDFATLPGYRGKGLASFLLQAMEEEMREISMKLLYTIARAYSFGMNLTFAKLGYECGGTLTNNTNISGGLESMNVWYKRI
jgi:putative beta-lysine N-acetyltransferase